jgi:NitT/TauT family transport system ATP-binding protein
MNDAGIRVRNVSHSFRLDTGVLLQVLDPVTVDIASAQWTAILGPSGSGKTTHLRILAGLLNPTNGEVTVNGQLVRPGLSALLFQNSNCFPWLSIHDNVAFAFNTTTGSAPVQEKVVDALREVGLSDYAKYLPLELSGGMQQRAGLARLIITDRSVWLLDEPFSALDPYGRAELRRLVAEHAQRGRRTVVMVTHHVGEALHQSDRVIVLSGRPARIKYEINHLDDLRKDSRLSLMCEAWLERTYSQTHPDEDPPVELAAYCRLIA